MVASDPAWEGGMNRRLLFCWELGAGTGHVSPYLPLLVALRSRGWDIAVAVRDTTEVSAMIRPHGFTLLQAPVCARLFSGVSADSFNMTETLLHFGYGDERSMRGLAEAWRALFNLYRPDLVLCSAAPTAQWVAQAEGLTHAMIGSGYNCPPPTQPLPLFRDWKPGVEQRLQNAEATVTSVLTAVRERVFHLGGTYTPQHLFGKTPELLCTFKELDHYPSRESDAVYHGILSARRFAALSARKYEVFAYLRDGPQTEGVIAALAQSRLRTLVYWPDAPTSNHRRLQGESLHFADRAIALEEVMGGCRFVVGYASHHLTAEALLTGKPLMLVPMFLEQELTARAVERIGAGISLTGKGRGLRLNRVINQMQDDVSLHESAQAFAARHASWSAHAAIEAVATRCEALLSNVSAVSRKVVAL
jgi:hypothetical protein